jgi:hypothetical protein
VAGCPRIIGRALTPREKLHLLVDELSDAEAEAALARLVGQRELPEHWIQADDSDATDSSWLS